MAWRTNWSPYLTWRSEAEHVIRMKAYSSGLDGHEAGVRWRGFHKVALSSEKKPLKNSRSSTLPSTYYGDRGHRIRATGR